MIKVIEKIEITLYFLLSVSIFILDMVIIKMIKKSSSILASQLSVGVPPRDFLIPVPDMFLTIFIVCGLIINHWICKENKYIPKNVFVIIIMIKEALKFKLFTCFNYPDNNFLMARSSLNLILLSVLIFITIPKCIYVDRSHKKTELCWYQICFAILTAASILAIFILNICLLVQANKSLEFNKNESDINMGYFNQTEIDAISNNSYVKDNFFEQRVIGTLSDIIYSNDKKLSHKDCTPNGCYNYYLRSVSFLF